MDEETANNKIKYLVADTTAFINAVPLQQYAQNVLTVPDVIAEVRNKRQIRRLCVIPFDLQVREPRTESVKHCVEFAKKTGDYGSLSGIDLKIISLSYELEVEHVGSAHLRNEPVMSQIIASRDKPEVMKDNTKLPGWYNSKNSNNDEQDSNDGVSEEEEPQPAEDKVKSNIEKKLLAEESTEVDFTAEESTQIDYTAEELEQAFENLDCSDNNFEEILQAETAAADSEEEAEENNNDDDDDDDSWITPSNIKQIKKSLSGQVEEDRVPIVSCMTTDFALQNVLKQMNLNISALDGRVIKHLRTYILRCYACYKTTSIMTKVFCPKCGNKTLKRVAVSLDENGQQVIHINTRRPLTRKYKNQSLPRFQGGKHSRNPILFEDQPIPRQMPSRVAKTKTNALDEDYIAGMSPFVMRDVDSKSALLREKGNLKEWARNNNFEEDRRRKHYNRLYK